MWTEGDVNWVLQGGHSSNKCPRYAQGLNGNYGKREESRTTPGAFVLNNRKNRVIKYRRQRGELFPFCIWFLARLFDIQVVTAARYMSQGGVAGNHDSEGVTKRWRLSPLGCYNKRPQSGCLINKRNVLFTDLETRRLRSMGQHG